MSGRRKRGDENERMLKEGERICSHWQGRDKELKTKIKVATISKIFGERRILIVPLMGYSLRVKWTSRKWERELIITCSRILHEFWLDMLFTKSSFVHFLGGQKWRWRRSWRTKTWKLFHLLPLLFFIFLSSFSPSISFFSFKMNSFRWEKVHEKWTQKQANFTSSPSALLFTIKIDSQSISTKIVNAGTKMGFCTAKLI